MTTQSFRLSASSAAMPKLMVTITACLMACVGCGSGSGAAPTITPVSLPPPVTMETLANVTGRDSFLGEQGKGYAHVCPGADRGHEPRSFLIVVPGFSPTTVDRQPATGELESACADHDDSANYHLVQTRWSTGADYIQRNAGFIRELIEMINEKYEINADDRLAIVGYSMGGLVSRYALQSMETEGVAHNMDLFVSVDSPQQGAYVPIGVQHITNVFKNDGARPMLDVLDTPAARQMLIYHYSQSSNAQTWTDDHQTLFVDELQGILGGFVRTEGLRTVAVSSGRIDGVLEQPAPGVRYFAGDLKISETQTVEYSFSASVCSDTLTFDFNIDIFLIPQAWSLGMTSAGSGTPVKVASSDVKTNVNDISIDDRAGLIAHFKAATKNQMSAFCGAFVSDALVGPIVDIAVEEGRDEAESYVGKYKDKTFTVPASSMVTEGVPAGLSDHIGQLRSTMRDNGFRLYTLSPGVQNKDTNAFIPVTSALMLTGVGPTDNLSVEMLEAASPFDKVYIEASANLDHLKTSSGWYALEVTVLFDAP